MASRCFASPVCCWTVALDRALERLAAIDHWKSEMLAMRYFGGLKQDAGAGPRKRRVLSCEL